MIRDGEQGISQLGTLALQRSWGGLCAVEEVNECSTGSEEMGLRSQLSQGQALVAMMKIIS